MAPYESKYLQFRADADKYVEESCPFNHEWYAFLKIHTLFMEEEYRTEDRSLEETYKFLHKLSKQRYGSLLKDLFHQICIFAITFMFMLLNVYFAYDKEQHRVLSVLLIVIYVVPTVYRLLVYDFIECYRRKLMIRILERFQNKNKRCS